MIQSRFKDATWFPVEETLLIGGCGGIGSWVTFFAARAGAEVFVFDDDTIEEHNLGGQLFPSSHIGMYKVKSIEETCTLYCGADNINGVAEKYVEGSNSNNIMISCFDNMKARKDFFGEWKKMVEANPEGNYLFIDGRLNAEHYQIYVVTPDRIEDYEATLFDDEEVAEASCTLKQTSHVAAMIAGRMFGYLTNYLSNLKIGKSVRAIPFYSEYNVLLNYEG